MADDPMDLFDKLADGIRSTQDELDAADALRRDEQEKQPKPPAPPGADARPPESK
jgi:hypothetical protein